MKILFRSVRRACKPMLGTMSSAPRVGGEILWGNSSNIWFHYARSVWRPTRGLGLKCYHVLNSGNQHRGESILQLTPCFTKLQVFQSHARPTPKLLPCTQPCETTCGETICQRTWGFTQWELFQNTGRAYSESVGNRMKHPGEYVFELTCFTPQWTFLKTYTGL